MDGNLSEAASCWEGMRCLFHCTIPSAHSTTCGYPMPHVFSLKPSLPSVWKCSLTLESMDYLIAQEPHFNERMSQQLDK